MTEWQIWDLNLKSKRQIQMKNEKSFKTKNLSYLWMTNLRSKFKKQTTNTDEKRKIVLKLPENGVGALKP